jgi:hypothetical protein
MLRDLFTAVVVLTSSACAAIAEEPVYFADSNLKVAVEQSIGKSNPTPTDMLRMITLEGMAHGIVDLSGLEYAVNVDSVYLMYNRISNIEPLSALANLRKLRLDGNRIASIQPLSSLTNLEELWLDENQIADIQPVSGLTKLKGVSLEYNQVTIYAQARASA